MPKREDSTENTHPQEIPTAVMEDNPFSDDSHTVVEDQTLDATPTTGPRADTDRPIDKFRRPTKSEIMRAVEDVNTQAVDMEEVVRARAEQQAEADEDED